MSIGANVNTIKSWNWVNIFTKIQTIFAYLPLLLLPAVFSPFSTNAFYIERLTVLLVCSIFSLLSLSLKIFYERKTSQSVPFFYSNFLKYTGLFIFYIIVSSLFALNFNQSLWGVGLLLIFGLLLWGIALTQVFDAKKVKDYLIIGILAATLLNTSVLITRFTGEGIFGFINPTTFSITGDFYSLVFLAFVGLGLSLYQNLEGKLRYVYISSIFINTLVIIIYSLYTDIFLFYYIGLAIVFILYFFYVYAYRRGTKTRKVSSQPNRLKKTISTSPLISVFSDGIKIIVIGAAIIVGIFEINLQKEYIHNTSTTLPVSAIVSTNIKILTENPKNLLIGVGPNNYSAAFLSAKGESVNTTALWNIEYSSSIANNQLQQIHITGVSILAEWGMGIVVIALIFILRYYRRLQKFKSNQNKFYQYLNDNYVLLLSFLFYLLLFLLTSVNIVTMFIGFVLFLSQFTSKKQFSVHFTLSSHNEQRINLTPIMPFVLSIIILIPLLFGALLLYISSFAIVLGQTQKNTELIQWGMNTFNLYPAHANAAIQSYRYNEKLVLDQNFSAKVREYGRQLFQQNPNDPFVNRALLTSLTKYGVDSSTLILARDILVNLINKYPNHIPYYLDMADLQMRITNYSTAGEYLDRAITLAPDKDLLLFKRASVFYLQGDKVNAKKYAMQAKNLGQTPNIQKDLDNLLINIENTI